MNQQEIFQNMTKGYWQYGVFNQVTCRQGHPLDGKVKDIAPHVVNDCDGRAIVTAVNWWQKLMGQGINPESVEKHFNWEDEVLVYLKSKWEEDLTARKLLGKYSELPERRLNDGK
jgi:hypothetical protein